MPNRFYRRRIRYSNTMTYISGRSSRFNINRPIQFNNANTSTNKLEIVYQYFYDLVDAISQHLELTIIIDKANQIIQIFSQKEQIYQVIDIIENNILEIITNIYESASIGIIQSRLEYLKGLLAEIPEKYDDYGRFGCILHEIIDSIISDMDFTNVIQSIGLIQNEMAENIELIDKLDSIHDTLFSVIQNISDGASYGILESRITYLKGLIEELGCS